MRCCGGFGPVLARNAWTFRDVSLPVGFMRELAVSRSMHIALDPAFVAC